MQSHIYIYTDKKKRKKDQSGGMLDCELGDKTNRKKMRGGNLSVLTNDHTVIQDERAF